MGAAGGGTTTGSGAAVTGAGGGTSVVAAGGGGNGAGAAGDVPGVGGGAAGAVCASDARGTAHSRETTAKEMGSVRVTVSASFLLAAHRARISCHDSDDIGTIGVTVNVGFRPRAEGACARAERLRLAP